LWRLKDKINRNNKENSTPIEDVQQRMAFSNGTLHDVAVVDVLVLIALDSKERGEGAKFVELCNSIALLLPLASDSEFKKYATAIRPNAFMHDIMLCVSATRIEHGLSPQNIQHYKNFVN
jgi:hypothetical protein